MPGDAVGWLMSVSRIPRDPTRPRAGTWRTLGGHRAVSVQSSVAVLPDADGHERTLYGLRAEILDMRGSAPVFLVEALAGGARVVTSVHAAPDDEYEELLDR